MQDQILSLKKQLAEITAWKNEVQGAMQRQGLQLLKTSEGQTDTMICYGMETESKNNQGMNDLISYNTDLEVQRKKLIEGLEKCLSALSPDRGIKFHEDCIESRCSLSVHVSLKDEKMVLRITLNCWKLDGEDYINGDQTDFLDNVKKLMQGS